MMVDLDAKWVLKTLALSLGLLITSSLSISGGILEFLPVLVILSSSSNFFFGAILGWIGGGKIANAVDSSMKAVDKAWEEGNIVGILDLAFGVFYDNVIAKIFNGIKN